MSDPKPFVRFFFFVLFSVLIHTNPVKQNQWPLTAADRHADCLQFHWAMVGELDLVRDKPAKS